MAFTESEKFHTVMGDRVFGCYQLTGDASDTAWSAPLSVIDAAWIQEYNTGSTGSSLAFTVSTNTITFGRTLAATEIVWVFYIGV